MDVPKTSRKTIAGKYVLVDRMPTRGASRLYRARQADSGRLVVVREFVPYDSTADESLSIYTKLAALHSRSLAELVDAGMLEDDLIFVAHSDVQGEPLTARIERRGAFPAVDAAAEIARILKGLEALHLRDIVHGALRPSRVFHERVERGWHVRLLGAGVTSLSRHEYRCDATLARYAPPEWLAGEIWTRASDVWVTGAILFELLTQRSPFQATAADEIVTMAATYDPLAVGRAGIEAPPEFLELLAASLDPKHENRPAHAGEMLDALVAIYPQQEKRTGASTVRRHWTQGKFVGKPSVAPLALPPAPESRTAVARRVDREVRSAQRNTMIATALGAALVFALFQWHPWRRTPAQPESQAPNPDPRPVVVEHPPAIVPPVNGGPSVDASAALPVDAVATPSQQGIADASSTHPGVTVHSPVRPRSSGGTVTAPVASGEGMLSFRTTNPCTLYLDGRARGDVTSLQVPLAAGPHEIVCRAGSVVAHRLVAHVRDGSVTRVRISAIGEAEISTEAIPSNPTP